MPDQEMLLEIQNLHVQYDTDESVVHAVNGLSFTLAKKQTLGLVGETGAGKTTAALSILGLLPKNVGRVTAGQILFEGTELLQVPKAEMCHYRGNKIAMIFQDPMTSLNPVIPVGKQVAEALEIHNNGEKTPEEIEQRVVEMFELVGIPASRKGDFPHQFSGGMKQRVVIAIALSCNPELLIADEPTTALDVTIQAQVLKMMGDLKHKLGTSMIMITHDLGVVAQTCDNVAVIYAGRVVESGRVEDIFEAERHHPYTEGLFGSIPPIDGEVQRLTPIDGLMPDPTDLPPGCVFSPRCKYAMPICGEQLPQAWTVDTHSIACHLFAPGQQGKEVGADA